MLTPFLSCFLVGMSGSIYAKLILAWLITSASLRLSFTGDKKYVQIQEAAVWQVGVFGHDVDDAMSLSSHLDAALVNPSRRL